jgi:predicted RND superfamily exporter protein
VIGALPFALISAALFGGVALLARARPHWIVDFPRTVLALIALVTLGMGAALVRFEPLGFRIAVDASSEPLLPANDPGEPVYQRAIQAFGDDDVFVIAMASDDVFTHERLALMRRVSDEIRKLPGVRGTESLVDVYAYRWDPDQELVEMGRFIEDVPDDAAAIAKLRQRALADPVYTRSIVSRDGKTAAINVSFEPMSDGEFAALGIDGSIGAILDGATADGVRFHVTGRPHVRAQAQELLIHDLVRLVPLAILVSVVALFLMTGSVRGTLVPLAANLTATFWAYGAMAIVGSDLNLITLVLGPALICIGGVTAVHSYACYETIAAESSSPREAALETLRYTADVVIIAGLTTMVGFAVLLINEIPATNELGGYCIFGVAAIITLTLTGMTALLALVPLESRQTRVAESWRRFVVARLERLGRWQVRHSRAVVAVWASAGVASCLLMPRIVTDTDFITFFRESSDVRVDFRAVNRLLTGAVPIYVVLEGSTEGTFREPAALRTVERLEERIAALPGVTSVLSAVDLVKVAHQALEQGDPAAARIPDTREELAELVFMIPKEKLRAFATSNHSSANLLVRTDRLGSAALRELEDEIAAELAKETLPEGVHAAVTGNTIRINRGADGIAGNQVLQIALTVAGALLIVSLVFRSVGLGILAMPTNLLPVFIFYGALGAGVAPLSIPISLIGSIALGITVDDTCHFLQAFRHRRAAGVSAEDATVECTVEVGRAMLTTSTMEVTGFLVMLFSSFATLQQFGYLTALTMSLCLTTDLVLLPAVLVTLRGLSEPARQPLAERA